MAENWNPQLRAPLTQPGVNVQAGEYLLACEWPQSYGQPSNIHSFFQNTANKQIVIRVGANPEGNRLARSHGRARAELKPAYVIWHGSKEIVARWTR
jgi:hypothetical protein